MHPAMLRQFTADHIRSQTSEAGDARRARRRTTPGRTGRLLT